MKNQLDQIHEEELVTLEMKISRFLRAGVLVAGVTMLIGWGWAVIESHAGWSDNPYAVFQTYHESPLGQELREAVQNRSWPVLISYLGLVMLISLPITRVFLTMVLFFRQKEKTLGFIALFVLFALIVSMLLGLET
jgi:uncharacterized membrane protein